MLDIDAPDWDAPDCCGGTGGRHQATLSNEAAIEPWIDSMLSEHPGFYVGLPYAQWGPPERMEMFDPRPERGPIGRLVPLEGPVTVVITLVRQESP